MSYTKDYSEKVRNFASHLDEPLRCSLDLELHQT